MAFKRERVERGDPPNPPEREFCILLRDAVRHSMPSVTPGAGPAPGDGRAHARMRRGTGGRRPRSRPGSAGAGHARGSHCWPRAGGHAARRHRDARVGPCRRLQRWQPCSIGAERGHLGVRSGPAEDHGRLPSSVRRKSNRQRFRSVGDLWSRRTCRRRLVMVENGWKPPESGLGASRCQYSA